MQTILTTCTPRESILKGTFNPEVFTAALGPVIQYYKTGTSVIDTIYTDAESFFEEATYPTDGLKNTISSVFRRISGDPTAPSIYRLETAFGGGKTHSLIACVHIANCGKKLAGITDDLISPTILPEQGSVAVVGIAGDEIPVNEVKGDKLVPYTLWGELAFQLGGQELYNAVKKDAESFAAPGRNFLEQVLGTKKILIMLDELAQYAARLEVAHADGASQLAAFIMALNGYAKNHSGIAIVVTLAGATDAFSKQTERLTSLLNNVSTEGLKADDAIAIAEKAAKGVTSVTMRDATAVTPVQAYEIASVLAKRLFKSIDTTAASVAADEYVAMYQRNSAILPEEAISVRFKERLISNYPFHPTLVDFLNNKLAQAENFQGTRGVLRVLAMTVRSIWIKHTPVGIIHASNIDMQNSAIVSEILGRTGSADLMNVLNADIGSTESHSLQGGLSNAQRADERNPHPDGIPLYEMTWKTVFLHSLVGRSEGKVSKLFGISQQDAVFAVATPIATPPQVKTALDEISESAFYLRYEDGKYFAHLEPTINSVLAMIRQTVDDKQIRSQLRSIANGLVKETAVFGVENDVHYPQDIPDGKEKPTIAVVAMDVESLDPAEFFKTKGDDRPRERQNMIVLLVAKTTKAIEDSDNLFGDTTRQDSWQRVETIARQVLAIKALEDKPQSYGIAPSKVKSEEFVERKRDREFSLSQVVSEMYTSIFYPGDNGVVRKEIRSAVGEGGVSIIGQIQQVMKDKLLTAENTSSSDLKSLSTEFFFKGTDKADIDETLTKLFAYRSWPMLAGKEAFDSIIRQGVSKGIWVVYKMSTNPDETLPKEIYTQEGGVPLSVTLLGKNYSVMTLAGAKLRGWTGTDKVAPEKVRDAVKSVLQASGATTVGEVTEAVQQQLGNVSGEDVTEQVQKLIQGSGYSVYQGDVEQQDKPESIVDGFSGAYYTPASTDVIISKAEQGERGWLSSGKHSMKLEGNASAKKFMALVKRLGSLYTRSGAASRIDSIDITDLQLPSGAKLRLQIDGAEAKDIKQLDEFFQVFAEAVKVSAETDIELVIENPNDEDALVKELRK